MKFLKVMNFSTIDLKFYEHVIDIKLPVNLTYMADPCTLWSIKNLEKLEFLYVDNKEPVKIPDTVLDIVNLSHPYFSGIVEFSNFRYGCICQI